MIWYVIRCCKRDTDALESHECCVDLICSCWSEYLCYISQRFFYWRYGPSHGRFMEYPSSNSPKWICSRLKFLKMHKNTPKIKGKDPRNSIPRICLVTFLLHRAPFQHVPSLSSSWFELTRAQYCVFERKNYRIRKNLNIFIDRKKDR